MNSNCVYLGVSVPDSDGVSPELRRIRFIFAPSELVVHQLGGVAVEHDVVDVPELIEHDVAPFPNFLQPCSALLAKLPEVLQAEPRAFAEELVISRDDIEVLLFDREVP